MSTAPDPRLTTEEYLRRERTAPHKSEFFRGRMFAMAGASPNHNRLVRNVLTQLDRQLAGRECEIFPSDLRLWCPAGLMTYPDATVVCGPLEYYLGTDDTVVNPRLIVEVLSKSTESYDRGMKAAYYREIPTLEEYVLVSYREPRVERFVRQAAQGWLLTEAVGDDATMELAAIGCRLTLAELYRDVTFPSPAPTVLHPEDE